MDYVGSGQIIKLAPHDTLVLSCAGTETTLYAQASAVAFPKILPSAGAAQSDDITWVAVVCS